MIGTPNPTRRAEEKALYDKIFYKGAYDTYIMLGVRQVQAVMFENGTTEDEFTRLVQLWNAAHDKLINGGPAVKSKAVISGTQGGGAPADDPRTTGIDETLLITDDKARLLAKAGKLGIVPDLHDLLLRSVGMEALERIYNRAGVHDKALSPDEQAALLDQNARALGLPEAVLDAMVRELGGLFETTVEHLHMMRMFGRSTKPKALTLPVPLVDDPLFGKVKPQK